MGKATTNLLMALALSLALSLTLTAVVVDAGAAGSLRRSRFLQSVMPPPGSKPLSYYDCARKTPSVCMEAGSPGKTCCKGTCTDTDASAMHCGNCSKTCKLGEACCGGKCVDLLNDNKNCGGCSVACSTKCRGGLCDYAG